MKNDKLNKILKQYGGQELNEDVIVEILSKFKKLKDIDNYCKTNKKLFEICKRNVVVICKSLLENNGYKIYDKDEVCKVLFQMNSLNLFDEKLKVTHFRKMLSKKMGEAIKFLEKNNRIQEQWKYNVAITFIKANKLKDLKYLHEHTGYDFRTRDNQEQLLLSIAENAAYSSKDYKILEYMLENGAKLDDYDRSEKWHLIPGVPEYVNSKTGLKARDLLIYGVRDEEHRNKLINIINKYN